MYHWKDAWKSASIEDGALCVMLTGTIAMLQWCAGNWGSLIQVSNYWYIKFLFIIMIFIIIGAIALSHSYVTLVFGNGVANIFRYNVSCTGDESRLQDCRSSQQAICGHSQDVGVRCSYRGNLICLFIGFLEAFSNLILYCILLNLYKHLECVVN